MVLDDSRYMGSLCIGGVWCKHPLAELSKEDAGDPPSQTGRVGTSTRSVPFHRRSYLV